MKAGYIGQLYEVTGLAVNPSPTDNGLTRTVTDRSATGVTKFYRVEVTKP